MKKAQRKKAQKYDEAYIKELREKAKWLKDIDADKLLSEIRGRDVENENSVIK